jgi:hypothetical protein
MLRSSNSSIGIGRLGHIHYSVLLNYALLQLSNKQRWVTEGKVVSLSLAFSTRLLVFFANINCIMIAYQLTYRNVENRIKCDGNPGLTVVYLGVGAPVINILARKFLRESNADFFGECPETNEINAFAFSSWLVGQYNFTVPNEDPEFVEDFGKLGDHQPVFLDDPWITAVKG